MVVTNFRRKAKRPLLSFVHCVTENAPVSFLSRDILDAHPRNIFFPCSKSCFLGFHVFHVHVRLAMLIGRAILCLFICYANHDEHICLAVSVHCFGARALYVFRLSAALVTQQEKKSSQWWRFNLCLYSNIPVGRRCAILRVYWRWLDWRRRAINVRCKGHAYITCLLPLFSLGGH